MNRKERRAEQFGHSSPNRHLYRPQQAYNGIQADIDDAFEEMCEDIRDLKYDAYFNGVDMGAPHLKIRHEAFYMATDKARRF